MKQNNNEDDISMTQFTFRLETALLEKVRLQAKKNRRSVAKEIQVILDEYFETHAE